MKKVIFGIVATGATVLMSSPAWAESAGDALSVSTSEVAPAANAAPDSDSVMPKVSGSIESNPAHDFASGTGTTANDPKLTIRIKKEDMSCEAVNEAVKRIPEGGTVYLPEGEWVCARPIQIDRNNIHLKGAGMGKTHLRAETDNPVPLIVIGSMKNTRMAGKYHLPYPDHQTVGGSLEDIDLDGGFRPPHEQNDLECWNPKTGKSQLCGADAGQMLRNNGVTYRGAEFFVTKNVNSHNNYSGGMVTEKVCKNLIFDNVQLHHNFFDGFAGYETTKAEIKNFKVYANNFAGLSLDANFDNNRFSHGEIYGNKDVGVFSADVRGNQYDHMQIHDNVNHGVFIENFRTNDGTGTVGSCDGTSVTNSIFKNNGESNGNGYRSAIRFGYPCKDVIIDKVRIEMGDGECMSSTSGVNAVVTNSTCISHGQEKPFNGKY